MPTTKPSKIFLSFRYNKSLSKIAPEPELDNSLLYAKIKEDLALTTNIEANIVAQRNPPTVNWENSKRISSEPQQIHQNQIQESQFSTENEEIKKAVTTKTPVVLKVSHKPNNLDESERISFEPQQIHQNKYPNQVFCARPLLVSSKKSSTNIGELTIKKSDEKRAIKNLNIILPTIPEVDFYESEPINETVEHNLGSAPSQPKINIDNLHIYCDDIAPELPAEEVQAINANSPDRKNDSTRPSFLESLSMGASNILSSFRRRFTSNQDNHQGANSQASSVPKTPELQKEQININRDDHQGRNSQKSSVPRTPELPNRVIDSFSPQNIARACVRSIFSPKSPARADSFQDVRISASFNFGAVEDTDTPSQKISISSLEENTKNILKFTRDR